MAEYAGSAMALTWVNTAGTLNLAPNMRQFTLGANQSVIDTTAGSDANLQSIPSFVTYAPSGNGVMQDGTAGTAIVQQLKAGVQGTLIYGPAGTVAGEAKVTVPAFSLGLGLDSPYSDVTTFTVDWSVASGGVVTFTTY